MSFDRERLPDPVAHHEAETKVKRSSSMWFQRSCPFCESSDAFYFHKVSGGFHCFACEVKGGDVLSYHMQLHGLEFIDACKALGCWIDDGKPAPQFKPAPLSPRAALQVLAAEANLAAIAAGNVACGVILADTDRARLMTASNRISRLLEAFA